jgi:hypothetical protein
MSLIKFEARFNWVANRGPNSLARNLHIAHAALDSEILKTTTPYVPRRTGVLMSSPIRASTVVGDIVYKTPYAAKMYYGDHFNFRKTYHPLATSRWLEKAKSKFMPQWFRIVLALITAQRK